MYSGSRLVSFTNSNLRVVTGESEGFDRSKSANASAVSSILAEGSVFSENVYNRFLESLAEERTKKACIRSKTLLLETDLCEIGCMSKLLGDELRVTIYFTPHQEVTNFNYSITK